ncbi:SDR family oxidoreductase [Phreatobacter sp. AB_2022a]|uniref:SDR family oxidoreductase n=1 Tax=Phreatobacter sp. AB_2022a TaxID=3003134 RepID=UPI00228723BD|nr:SDR family oxidoreductase [Phreatobacter sp. AB_2022a]MCZ0736801.1 DUF4166 domain-containing protein [Phreatobacter sp. AB_2022a]
MTEGRFRVLILGGYGTFGGRLARLLADQARLDLIIAGRSQDKAEAFCRALGGRARAEPLVLDRAGDLAAAFAAVRADLVVDASGPFQAYGVEPYGVVDAAIAAGMGYIDLADGAAFVAGIGTRDAAARARNVFVLSGASSFPVLSAAVTRRLADGGTVETITGGVAPSPRAGIGLNVIRAIAGYAGRPIALRREGLDTTGVALVESITRTVAPPGHLPLGARRFSLVEVPDLTELPRLWPELRSVWVGAGTLPAVWQRGLNGFARLVRRGLLPSLERLAPLFHTVTARFAWGEHRGGMLVEATGLTAEGQPFARSWHLLAEGDAGPFIPAMPAAVLVRRCVDGRRPASGARSAAAGLELDDFAASFAAAGIVHGTRDDRAAAAEPSLYRRILGPAFDRLPAEIRAMHGAEPRFVVRGRAEVERGRGPLSWLAGALIGFPKAAADVPLEVVFARDGGREIWRRCFAGRSFSSIQEAGHGKAGHLLIERFGVARFDLALVVADGRLSLVPRRWSVLGVPLPLALAPAGSAFEAVEDGRFRFHVEIGHRRLGLIVRYRGWLEPVPEGSPEQSGVPSQGARG